MEHDEYFELITEQVKKSRVTGFDRCTHGPTGVKESIYTRKMISPRSDSVILRVISGPHGHLKEILCASYRDYDLNYDTC